MTRKGLIRSISYTALFLVLFAAFGLYRLNVLNEMPLKTANFSTLNKIEIYVLGLVMSVAAYPLYPEVAREHLMLYRPFNGKPKIIEDDFFMKSKVVSEAVSKAKASGKEVRLWWPTSAYTLSVDPKKYWEARIALAFNGGWVSVRGDEVRARIPIAYPKKAFAPLISVPWVGTLGVQEGLFNILQQVGWYHTGEAIWIGRLTSTM